MLICFARAGEGGADRGAEGDGREGALLLAGHGRRGRQGRRRLHPLRNQPGSLQPGASVWTETSYVIKKV